jgi:transposase InsO family protein
VLREYHDSPNSAHLGEAKTYERLADLYYWKGMAADIKQYVASCLKCAQRKTYNRRQSQNIPLLSLLFPALPFEALGIDVLGPLPRTKSGSKYILVITDHFTRWPMAFPMRNQKSATIATLLVERVFCEHGYPATLLSDQGSNFLSNLIAAVLKLFAVKKLTTSAYHPQTNGLTERFNHTLCTMLSHYVNRQTDNWDEYLPYVLLAYRSAPSATTRAAPFYLLYGRLPRMPLDHILSPSQPIVHLDHSAAAEYMLNLSERLKRAHDMVTQRERQIADHRREHTARLDSTGSIPRNALGQLVFVDSRATKPHTSRKLTARWEGPYKVVLVHKNRVNYWVQRCSVKGELSARNEPVIVYITRMKAYVVQNAASK